MKTKSENQGGTDNPVTQMGKKKIMSRVGITAVSLMDGKAMSQSTLSRL